MDVPRAAADTRGERFSWCGCGLRISDRAVSAEQWNAFVASRPGMSRVSFARVSELERRQDRDRVLIGVLYDNSSLRKFENGSYYICWKLTDLGESQARLLNMRLTKDAYWHWRTGQNAESVTRGSIFAVMNPELIQEPRKEGGGTPDWALRVEKSTQILRLGTCPSLGSCTTKGCLLPCNTDYGDRFCAAHLQEAYAAGSDTRLVVGGFTADQLSSANVRVKRKRKPKDETEEAEEPASGAQLSEERASVALRLDNRRLLSSDANHDYIRAIRLGVRAETQATSHVPVLGRSMDGKDEVEFDLATIETGERRKAERMIEQRSERAEAAQVRSEKCSEPSSGLFTDGVKVPIASSKQPRRQTTNRSADVVKPPAVLQKRALGELVQAMAAQKIARREAAASRSSSSDKAAGGVLFPSEKRSSSDADTSAPPAAVSSGSDSADTAAAAQGEQGANSTSTESGVVATDDLLERAQGIARELVAAGQDTARIRALLADADGLTENVYIKSGLYETVGNLIKQAAPSKKKNEKNDGNEVILRLASSARRRWRAACDAENERAAAAAKAEAARRTQAEAEAAADSPPVLVAAVVPEAQAAQQAETVTGEASAGVEAPAEAATATTATAEADSSAAGNSKGEGFCQVAGSQLGEVCKGLGSDGGA
eukprot:gnl/TRDRNA2_/TRDRNA2_181540_c0_seq1.p1 gnl/TRDRNA2_/TRDRNA2_181540_c0~~gnl/TRDRNA2_/TRDRNA2_181540_c0_seq1.p1  ORF type:complete len:677 (-),score=144.10 gnl/TRDRNA2_/TRDRNA2_181540_c0_seq1:46-2022(-)